jgi:hypothetical protein
MSTHVGLKMRVMAAIAEEPSLTRRGVRRLRLLAASIAGVGMAAASWTELRLEPFRWVLAHVLPAFSAAFIGALLAGLLMDAGRWVRRRPRSPPAARASSALLH